MQPWETTPTLPYIYVGDPPPMTLGNGSGDCTGIGPATTAIYPVS